MSAQTTMPANAPALFVSIVVHLVDVKYPADAIFHTLVEVPTHERRTAEGFPDIFNSCRAFILPAGMEFPLCARRTEVLVNHPLRRRVSHHQVDLLPVGVDERPCFVFLRDDLFMEPCIRPVPVCPLLPVHALPSA